MDNIFSGLVAQGIGIWIGVQVCINVAVATGLMPTKGLTLPLMSYGGSAIVATLCGIALLLRVDHGDILCGVQNDILYLIIQFLYY